MKKTSIHEIAIENAPRGIFEGRYLYRTAEGGQIADGKDKTGAPILRSYTRGSFVLADAKLNILAGPISLQGAAVFALEIVSGSQRAVTEPAAALRLAIAILGLTLNHLPPEADAAAVKQSVEPQARKRDVASAMIGRPVRSEAEGDSVRTIKEQTHG